MSTGMPTPRAMQMAREITEGFRPLIHSEGCPNKRAQMRCPCIPYCPAHRIETRIAEGLDRFAGGWQPEERIVAAPKEPA